MGVLKRIKFCGSFSCGIFLQQCFFCDLAKYYKNEFPRILFLHSNKKKLTSAHTSDLCEDIFFSMS